MFNRLATILILQDFHELLYVLGRAFVGDQYCIWRFDYNQAFDTHRSDKPTAGVEQRIRCIERNHVADQGIPVVSPWCAARESQAPISSQPESIGTTTRSSDASITA